MNVHASNVKYLPGFSGCRSDEINNHSAFKILVEFMLILQRIW